MQITIAEGYKRTSSATSPLQGESVTPTYPVRRSVRILSTRAASEGVAGGQWFSRVVQERTSLGVLRVACVPPW